MVPNFAVLFGVSLLLTPLARPLRASRLALTYALPAIPLLYAWDGTVSALRAHSPDELLAITRSLEGADRYAFTCDTRGLALALLGRPRS